MAGLLMAATAISSLCSAHRDNCSCADFNSAAGIAQHRRRSDADGPADRQGPSLVHRNSIRSIKGMHMISSLSSTADSPTPRRAMTGDPPTDNDSRWPVLAVGWRPAGERQQMVCLLVWTALSPDSEQPATKPSLEDVVDAAHTFGEAVQGPHLECDIAATLGKLVVWRRHSAPARQAAQVLVDRYKREHGLLIDLDARVIAMDSRFDVGVEQGWRHNALRWRRERAALIAARHTLTRAHIPQTTRTQALDTLLIPRSRPERELLRHRLRAAGVHDRDCRTALFVLDYLCWQATDLDLLTEAPVLVDPGADQRGRLRERLEYALDPARWEAFYDRDMELAGAHFEAELTVLSPADQQLARARRDAILNGATDCAPLWPGTVSRGALDSALCTYAGTVKELQRCAKHLSEQLAIAASEAADFRTYVGRQLDDLRAHRAAVLQQLRHTGGLLTIERFQAQHLLEAIDHGETSLPELRFVAESDLRSCDIHRSFKDPTKVGESAAPLMRGVLERAGIKIYDFDDDSYAFSDIYLLPNDAESRAFHAVDEYIASLAKGEEPSHDFAAEARRGLDHLDKALTLAGMDACEREDFRAMVEGYLASATFHGTQLEKRRTGWRERRAQIVRARDTEAQAFPDPHADLDLF
ncbi:hypothetical protein [Nocardia niwae]|uniref:hypothetical protein n=1 Tax=Nocardia niwae TaxID=626084 RepID=UPI0033C8EB2E